MRTSIRMCSGTMLLLSVWTGAAAAETGQGPDRLIQASTQAAHAETLLERCSYPEAERWLHRALETARSSRSANSVERDTAGSLVARLEIQLADLQRRRKQLDREAKELARLVSAGRLETAQRRLAQLDPPECDERFKQLQSLLQARSAEAQSLTEQGDRYLRQHAPGTAHNLYQHAQRLNREQPRLDARIAKARSAKRAQRRIGAKIGKVILYTAIAAGIGYSGYLGYRSYKERAEAPPPVRRPATAARSPN